MQLLKKIQVVYPDEHLQYMYSSCCVAAVWNKTT